MKKAFFILLAASLVTFVLSINSFAYAQTTTPDCVSCHESAANFSVPSVNKVYVCWKCHYQSSHSSIPLVPTSDGYFTYTSSPDFPSAIVHAAHDRKWSSSLTCVRCHETADCSVCHETVSHASHGSTMYPPVSLTVCNGWDLYLASITCANSLCHGQLPTIVSQPFCTNCHLVGKEGHGDVTALHVSSELTQDCISSNCHSSSSLNIEHQNRGYNCLICHNNPDPNRAVTLRNAINSNNTNCSACHEVHGDITAIHTSSANDCTECHSVNIMNVHGDNCSKCHDNPAVTPTAADCTTCHSTKPHSVSCTICHGTKYSTSTYRASDIHMKHTGKVLCGVCHRIPASTILERTGQYCTVCHGSAKSYDPSRVYKIHKRHAEAGSIVPDTCNMCHGKTTPTGITSKNCNVCHPNTSRYSYDYYSGRLTDLHRRHRDVECTNCHHAAQLTFDRRTSCLRCHDIKGYRSVFSVHDKHFKPKALCDACHGSTNVYASAGYSCQSCHGYTPRYSSRFDVHKKHAGHEYPCAVCHALK